MKKKHKHTLPGQVKIKGIKDAIEHVKKIMGELHIQHMGVKK